MKQSKVVMCATVANMQEIAFRAMRAAAGDSMGIKKDEELASDIAASLNKKIMKKLGGAA